MIHINIPHDYSIKRYLQRISNILLLNGGFFNNSGLYTGEMGLVLFFFRYARFTQNELLKEYGFELIEKVQKRIHQGTPISYKHGLAGIGSAIEYLEQNSYIEADTDEILEDFDNRIFSIQNMSLFSMEEILSIGYYANWRISGNSNKKYHIEQSILSRINNICFENSIIPIWNPLYNKYNMDVLNIKTFSNLLKHILNNDIIEINNLDLGFEKGLVGLGMTLLSELDGEISWTLLFPNDFNSTQNESLPL